MTQERSSSNKVTHLYIDTNSVNCEFNDASEIQLLDVQLKEKLPNNVSYPNNKILWIIREVDGSQTNRDTVFPDGFFSLEDIQLALNNDLKSKGCSISFQFKYNMNRITLFKIKPFGCKIDVFLLGNYFMKSLGFTTQVIENYPASNNEKISLFPYGIFELHCDVIDSYKNLVNGEPSKLFCMLSYPFTAIKDWSVKKATIKRFSQINFTVKPTNIVTKEFFNFFFKIEDFSH